MRHRYLDLRRESMQRSILLRHKTVKFIRDFLEAEDFIEIETPILFKTTPEGARDFLVPSRLQPGMFYALPQSPQQLKQLLMVGGFERYFQIARCFRDEDLRGDRQPEFTQLDLEMSFRRARRCDAADGSAGGGNRQKHVTPEKRLIAEPFPRIRYRDALEQYGTDRPDIRFDLRAIDISDIASRCAFPVFVDNVKAGQEGQMYARARCGRRAQRHAAAQSRERPGKYGAAAWRQRLGLHHDSVRSRRRTARSHRQILQCGLEAGIDRGDGRGRR